jgi:hypothetical protein
LRPCSTASTLKPLINIGSTASTLRSLRTCSNCGIHQSLKRDMPGERPGAAIAVHIAAMVSSAVQPRQEATATYPLSRATSRSPAGRPDSLPRGPSSRLAPPSPQLPKSSSAPLPGAFPPCGTGGTITSARMPCFPPEVLATGEREPTLGAGVSSRGLALRSGGRVPRWEEPFGGTWPERQPVGKVGEAFLVTCIGPKTQLRSVWGLGFCQPQRLNQVCGV